ncbi:MAG: SufD family Fe-S cluster assembly protein [Candidatus Nezhaarchaeota archaeon]|nr:SufD family Fe-S cluster assembly protein [Candidatus Nezhaarchaeota archaeon]MCX8142574.1 SufD family Fe-S cluster assembly protein [Candidatus Nezhaarchaeota archaeon]
MPSRAEYLDEIKRKAKEALTKPPKFGPDLDLLKFKFEAEKPRDWLTDDLMERAKTVGIDFSEKERAGTYFQIDHFAILEKAAASGLEVMSTSSALEKYDWLLDYYWRALKVDTDKFTALAEVKGVGGYFMRAKAGAKISFPVQACLYLRTPKVAQGVHNIIIVEEGAELHVITGCTAPKITEGLHVGISEFYVKRGGKLTFTMIHGWTENVDVRPRTAVIVEEDATFTNIYVNLNPVRTFQAMPTVYLNGKNAKTNLTSIIAATGNSHFDVGGAVYLRSEGAKAEVISKTVAKDRAFVIARGIIVSEMNGVKGHLECKGIMLSPTSTILAIPELEARAKDVELSHEAAIGKIAEEEVYYLMTRGFSEEEATSIIIRGFMDVDVKGLPPLLGAQIKKAIDIAAKGL